MPTDIVPGVKLPAGAVFDNKKHEIRDANGKLIYLADNHGNWIESSHEIAVPAATEADWTALDSRLGNGFTITWDGANINGTIAGVEGLYFNRKGEVDLDLGNDIEVFHPDNVKSQIIDGRPTLLVAGYAWNGETKAWEVFNPGFAMEDPKTELGWFNESDVANGNWLRWHQRALENLATQNGYANVDEYMKELFKDKNGNPALTPDKWKFLELKTDKKAMPNPADYSHYSSIWWENPDLLQAFNTNPVDETKFISRDQFPIRSGLSNAYRIDLDEALTSIDLLNPNESRTSLPTIIDRKIVWENKGRNENLSKIAEACGVDPTVIEKVTGIKKSNKNWMIWPLLRYYSDQKASIWYSDINRQVFEDQASIDRRMASIKNGNIDPSASIETWGEVVNYDLAIQYWQWLGNELISQ